MDGFFCLMAALPLLSSLFSLPSSLSGSGPWRVLVGGEQVGILWAARGGGYTLRTGASLVRPNVHHFSPNEGMAGLTAYIEERFGGTPELVET